MTWSLHSVAELCDVAPAVAFCLGADCFLVMSALRMGVTLSLSGYFLIQNEVRDGFNAPKRQMTLSIS